MRTYVNATRERARPRTDAITTISIIYRTFDFPFIITRDTRFPPRLLVINIILYQSTFMNLINTLKTDNAGRSNVPVTLRSLRNRGMLR